MKLIFSLAKLKFLNRGRVLLNWRLLFGVIFACGFFIATAQAADERFAVELDVDVTDVNASVAREKAMKEANRVAFVEVAKRVTTAEGAARLAGMTDAQLINFIKEVSIIEEKTSSVRYLATLQVVLNEDMLTEYMKEREIPMLIQGNSRVLVVPVFRAFPSDRPLLWESNNQWKQAWDNVALDGVVRFINLPSSGTNYSIIDANKALMMDGAALDKLMRANNVDDVYVLDAVYDGIEGLNVTMTSYSGDGRTVKISGDRSLGMELFNKAVKQVKEQMEQNLKQQSVQADSQESEVIVMFNFNNLREWVEAEAQLRDIPYVKGIQIQAMGSNRAQFKINFIGSHDKLLYSVRAKSYNLIDNGKFFVLEKI